MTKPTKAQIQESKEGVIMALAVLRGTLPFTRQQAVAFRELETFCAISLRVMSLTNVSKLREQTRIVEIAARMAGQTVFSPD